MPAKSREQVTHVSHKTLHMWLYSTILRAFITLTTPKLLTKLFRQGWSLPCML